MFAKFVFVDHTTGWPGVVLFECFAFKITDADKLFEQATGLNPVKVPTIGVQVHRVEVGEILMQSDLFTSKSDCVRMIKQKGVKVNGELVDSFAEHLELGDFLNFVWVSGSHYSLGNLIVARGKQKCWLQLEAGKFKSLVR